MYELFCGVSMSSTGVSCVHYAVCQYIQQKNTARAKGSVRCSSCVLAVYRNSDDYDG